MKRVKIFLNVVFVFTNTGAAAALKDALSGSPAVKKVWEETYSVSMDLDDGADPMELLKAALPAAAQKLNVDEAAMEKAIVKVEDSSAEPVQTPPVVPPVIKKPQRRAPSPEVTAEGGTVLEKIRRMKGADEFIRYCEDIVRVAPLLRAHDAAFSLVRRGLLFSIDPGCGLSTAAQLLAELLREQNLLTLKGGELVYETVLPAPGTDKVLENAAAKIRSNAGRVVCVDISNWTDKVFDPEFRDFLLEISRHAHNLFYIFRVPYLEQKVLHRIADALGDVMTVQCFSFVPLTTEELQRAAAENLQAEGFSADEEAWEVFRAMLACEKSDGRFYGIKTVERLADEMIFRQLLACAENGTDTDTVRGADIRDLLNNDNGRGELSPEEQLDLLVGIEPIRKQLDEILAQIEFARSNRGVESPGMHMCFVGNPGTGKTTVARILGRLLRKRGILTKGGFYEHSGGDFIGMYVGHTVPKTLALCRDAYGSVLFIDEAYTLANQDYDGGKGFAREAVDALIAQMENHREDMVVIMAGYPNEMGRLLELNPGLKGRIPYTITFPNYSRQELAAIFTRMVENSTFTAGEGLKERTDEFFADLEDSLINSKDFSNARFVRNLFERTWSKTIMRAQMDGSDPTVLRPEDFDAACAEDGLMSDKPRSRVGFRLN